MLIFVIAVRRSKYAEKTMMLNMKSERDKAMMAEANLPVPRGIPSTRYDNKKMVFFFISKSMTVFNIL